MTTPTPTTVSGVLTDTVTDQPIPNEPVTLSLNSNESCTGPTDATGTASCSITPSEPAGDVPADRDVRRRHERSRSS